MERWEMVKGKSIETNMERNEGRGDQKNEKDQIEMEIMKRLI